MKKVRLLKTAAAAGLSMSLLLQTAAFPAMAGPGQESQAMERTADETSQSQEAGAADETSQSQEAGAADETSQSQETGAADESAAAQTKEGPASQAKDGPAAQTEGNPAESLPEREVAESEIAAFYADSVFVGDSVMVGFRNYCMSSADEVLKSLSFLAAGSYSVHNALWPVSKKSKHPLYQGAQRPVWESISMMQKKKVFMFFGLNDLNMGNDTCERYQEVIGNIKLLSPDAQFYIISMTYTLRGKGKGNLNNDNIRIFNAQLQQLAAENGWGYIDLASPLSDANGDLAPEYCSDNYVHQTTAAYQVWTNVLKQYARDQLKYTPAPEA